MLKLPMLTVIVRSVFEDDDKYYSLFFRWMSVWSINARIWQDGYFRRDWY